VVWYSQTGYTARTGKLLAKTMEQNGLTVTGSEIRDIQPKEIEDYDLLVVGSPVFYYDSPSIVKDWIISLPDLDGTPVAAFVTFGGPEGNQHNAACSILEWLSEKEGVPIALKAFMNMGTYPPAWTAEDVNDKKWRNSDLPNETTYAKIRDYAVYILDQVKQGKSAEFAKTFNLREFSTLFGPIWWTKRMVDDHSIIEDKCISCGTCVEKCPVDAIDLDNYSVDTEACVLCFGCLNNCPAQAVNIEYRGRKLIGFKDFMKMKNLKVIEPEEFRGEIDAPRSEALQRLDLQG
jgi:ferredoxin/flavodoxin